MTTTRDGGRHGRALLGYHFVARGPELRIEHEFVESVVVRLEPYAFTIDPPSDTRATLLPGAEPPGPVSFDLCDAERAADHVLAAIRARCRRRVPVPPLPIVQGHLLAARSRGLRRIHPDAHDVQRAVLAVDQHVPRLACHPDFYADRFLARDVVRYRAAAIALARLDDLYAPWCRSRGLPANDGPESKLAALRDWRSLFSPNGQTYRSLNRTLMNLPTFVPAGLVTHLRSFVLERPLTGPRALTATLLHASDARAARLAEASELQRKCFERASERDIGDAVAAIAEFTGRSLSPDRLEDIGYAVRFVIDDVHPFHGRLAGLVRRAIQWHEGLRRRRARERWRPPEPPPPRPAPDRTSHALRRPLDQPTARPPVPLPDVDGIEFLASVNRVRAEARRMDNCIASYARSAVAGECFLFHVRHRGEHASVEVDPRGNVRQAEGPSNSSNRASEWGAQRLQEWGRSLARARRPVRRMEPPPLPRIANPDPDQMTFWNPWS